MEHIGNRIKNFIEGSKLSSVEVAKQMNTSYQNLYRIFNRESVETRYLFELSKILNIPVTSFFENETGKKFTQIDVENLRKENEELNRKIDKLELEKDNLNLLIEFIKKENLIDSGKIISRNNNELADKSKTSLDSLVPYFKEFEEDFDNEAGKAFFKFMNSDNARFKTKDEKFKAVIQMFEDFK